MIKLLSDNPFKGRLSIPTKMITRSYVHKPHEFIEESLKDFVEQKEGESEEAYKSRLKEYWVALNSRKPVQEEEEEEGIEEREEREKEVLTFVFNQFTLQLTIAEWREFKDYKGPDFLKSSTTDENGNQYNIYVKPERCPKQ